MRGKSRQHVVDSMKGRESLPTTYRLLPTEKKSLPTTYCILPTEKGFTLVELMITMTVFVLVIAGASQIFTGLLTQFKQQSKIAETNIEGAIGLEILRQDLEHAGYGLPWVIPSDVTYTAAETFSATPCGTGTTANPTTFNDSTPNAPRAVVSGNNTCLNGSDYLVIKAINVATNNTSNKWALLGNTGVLRYDISGDAFNTSDRVVVLDPGTSDATMRTLVGSGSTFYKQYSAVTDFNPSDSTTTRFIYGIRDGAAPKVPLNRADYYISIPATMPSQCAVGTGVLYKATMNHGSISGVNQFTELPLLDCVADMQVVYALDNDEDGDFENGVGGDAYTNDISGLAGATGARDVRTRVKELRVYILAHEGQYDKNFTFSGFTAGACATCVRVGLSNTFGRDFEFATSGITNWQNYRWKIYTIVVKPNNLSGEK
ncbi:MAG: prepilin-type N-terminal cleavage/methylation domain-containing protein [Nitrospirota bacterium]